MVIIWRIQIYAFIPPINFKYCCYNSLDASVRLYLALAHLNRRHRHRCHRLRIVVSVIPLVVILFIYRYSRAYFLHFLTFVQRDVHLNLYFILFDCCMYARFEPTKRCIWCSQPSTIIISDVSIRNQTLLINQDISFYTEPMPYSCARTNTLHRYQFIRCIYEKYSFIISWLICNWDIVYCLRVPYDTQAWLDGNGI